MTKWALSQEWKDSLIYANQCIAPHNKLKDKNHMIISIDAEKAFDKIQHPFKIKKKKEKKKTSPESRRRRNTPQHNNSYIGQTHSKHYSQCWKIESISLKVRNKTRVTTLSTTIQHSFGSVGHRSQSRKKNRIQIGKKEVKLSLFADDMILYIENP